jgi:hypothetical protein
MKFILKLLVFFLFLGIAIVITGIFLPQKFKSIKKAEINASPIIVFEQINNLKNWQEWHPWFETDSTIKIEYQAKTEGKGAEMIVNGRLTGKCKVKLTHSVYPESIAVFNDYEIESKNIVLIFLEPTSKGTRINYTFNITQIDLWERYFVLFNKKKINRLVKESVKGLKEVSEELKYSRIGEIAMIDSIESKPAVIKIDSVHHKNLEEQIILGFDYLDRFFERREITPLDKPFVLRYGLINDTLEKFAVGRIIPEKTWVWRTLNSYEIPEGKSLVVSYFGGRNTSKAHQALKEYIRNNGLIENGQPREVALYEPDNEPDSSLWETMVYYPVE